MRTELSSGWAAEHLIGLSAAAELVVLGSRGLGGFTGLVAVHVWMDFAMGPVWESALAGEWESIQNEEIRSLNRQLAACREELPDVPVEQVVSADRPAHALIEHTKNAQLVVVGARGRGGFRGLLLGSTSQALIYHSACPVAVVPSVRR